MSASIAILQELEPFDCIDCSGMLRHTLAVDRLNRRRLRFWFWVLVVAAAALLWPFLGRYRNIGKGGAVLDAMVISGPEALRTPAIKAARHENISTAPFTVSQTHSR